VSDQPTPGPNFSPDPGRQAALAEIHALAEKAGITIAAAWTEEPGCFRSVLSIAGETDSRVAAAILGSLHHRVVSGAKSIYTESSRSAPSPRAHETELLDIHNRIFRECDRTDTALHQEIVMRSAPRPDAKPDHRPGGRIR
jgi:hypothetical protein